VGFLGDESDKTAEGKALALLPKSASSSGADASRWTGRAVAANFQDGPMLVVQCETTVLDIADDRQHTGLSA
jgi:hypothetical protein